MSSLKIESNWSQTTDSISFCVEDWNDDLHLVYKILISFIQFIIPLGVISALYTNTWKFLREKDNSETFTGIVKQRRMARMRRTNMMLITVSIMFLISMLPITVFSLSLNFMDIESYSPDWHQTFLLIFAGLHLISMSYVITNPIMYGLLNCSYQQNFSSFILKFRSSAPSSRSNTRSNGLSGRSSSAPNNMIEMRVIQNSPQAPTTTLVNSQIQNSNI